MIAMCVAESSSSGMGGGGGGGLTGAGVDYMQM